MPTDTFNTAGNHSWTCPAGVTSVQGQGWGGGGGGGDGGGMFAAGGAGGGGFGQTNSIAVTPGNVYTASVGAGGSVGTAGGDGGDGGDTIFTGDSAQHCGGGGGKGGKGSNNGAAGGAAGAGGGAGCDLSFAGGAGAAAGANGGGGGSSAGTAGAGNNASGSTGGTAPTGGSAGGNGAIGGTSDATAAGQSAGGGGGAQFNVPSAGGAGEIILTYTAGVAITEGWQPGVGERAKRSKVPYANNDQLLFNVPPPPPPAPPMGEFLYMPGRPKIRPARAINDQLLFPLPVPPPVRVDWSTSTPLRPRPRARAVDEALSLFKAPIYSFGWYSPDTRLRPKPRSRGVDETMPVGSYPVFVRLPAGWTPVGERPKPPRPARAVDETLPPAPYQVYQFPLFGWIPNDVRPKDPRKARAIDEGLPPPYLFLLPYGGWESETRRPFIERTPRTDSADPPTFTSLTGVFGWVAVDAVPRAVRRIRAVDDALTVIIPDSSVRPWGWQSEEVSRSVAKCRTHPGEDSPLFVASIYSFGWVGADSPLLRRARTPVADAAHLLRAGDTLQPNAWAWNEDQRVPPPPRKPRADAHLIFPAAPIYSFGWDVAIPSALKRSRAPRPADETLPPYPGDIVPAPPPAFLAIEDRGPMRRRALRAETPDLPFVTSISSFGWMPTDANRKDRKLPLLPVLDALVLLPSPAITFGWVSDDTARPRAAPKLPRDASPLLAPIPAPRVPLGWEAADARPFTKHTPLASTWYVPLPLSVAIVNRVIFTGQVATRRVFTGMVITELEFLGPIVQRSDG